MNRAQLRAILWLRLRLTRNQWARSRGIGPVLTLLLVLLAGAVSLASFVGGALGGYFGLGHASPATAMFVWAGMSVAFGFWWLVGLLSDLQRSELIDLPRLMHLPVRLGQLYAVNYLASHVGLSVPLFALGALGLSLGSALARGPAMLLTFPAFLALMFSVTAWTYCFQGWIATQVTNPRRRRMLVVGFTLVLVVGAQVPNLMFNVFGPGGHRHAKETVAARIARHHQAEKQMVGELERVIELCPPLWPGAAARDAAQGRPLFPLLSIVALAAVGALGLRRGYRGTLRFYQGAAGGEAAPSPPPERSAPTPPARGRRLVERSVPGVHPQTSAVALATLRSLLRAPEVAVLVGAQVVVALCLGAFLLLRGRGHVPPELAPLAVLGAVAFVYFLLTQFLVNQFGLDRDGLRALILSPVPRHRVLLGKSLATGTVVGVPSGLLLGAALVALHLGPLQALAGVFQWLTLLVLALLIGALLSIVAPFRINPGSMRAAKMPPLAVVVLLACQLLFPVTLTPAALGPLALLLFHVMGWPHGALVELAVSAGVAALVVGLYGLALGPLGRLLARREPQILARVAVNEE